MSLALWQKWNSTYSQSLPTEEWWWNTIEQVREEAEVIALHADGKVVAVCDDNGKTHRVFASLDPSTEPLEQNRAGCTCERFVSSSGCRHLFELHAYLVNNLPIKSSRFSKQIINDQFSASEFESKGFTQDRSSTTIDAIARMADQLQVIPTNDSLPLTPEEEQLRNAWSLDLGDTENEGSQRWSITPILQRSNKAGTGFLKGEVVAPELLLHYHNEILSDLDRQLLSIQTRPYWKTHSNLDDIIPHLLGVDNFLFKNKPIQIRKANAYLTLVDENEQSRIEVANTLGALNGVSAHGRTNRYTFDVATQTLTIVEFPANAIGLFDQLSKLPAVAKTHRNDLILQLQRLQSKFPVLIPEDNHSEIRSHAVRMMILLRSNAAGVLDFGLRIQCINGVISLPGTYPLIVTTLEDKGVVQWLRSPESEISVAHNFLTSLGLHCTSTIPFSGSIKGYEAIFEFLEKLGKWHSEIEVLWDKNSKETLRFLGRIAPSQLRVQIKSKKDWFGVTGECALDATTLSLEELLSKLDGTKNPLLGKYIQLRDGEWASIGEELLNELKLLREATNEDRSGLSILATDSEAVEKLSQLGITLEISNAWEQAVSRIKNSNDLAPVVPSGLQAQLRDYQVDGYVWLSRLSNWGIGGILADDMGLGKTLQAIALLLDKSQSGPALVLAPTSVGFNWIREIKRFAPTLNPVLYREGDRRELLNSLKAGDVVVSSYAIALRDKSELADIDWNILVCDEAQAIKNSQTKTAKAVANLKPNWSLALTGTPIENHLGELWSLMHVVAPGVLGSWEFFKKRYASPIEKNHDPVAMRSLSQRLKPFILRRTKAEVLTELPPRTESILTVTLSDAERAQYELVRRSALGEIESLLQLTQPKDKQFRILALLLRLRQFACHPGIVNKQWDRSSSKLDLLCTTLESLRDEGRRALVFSQFTEHLGLIRQELENRKITFEYLDGSTPALERQQCVDSFQTGSATAFLISLKAGGTGLNLTAADYVIHMDPWWNPAVEDQATDRAHRMGQEKPVMVYRIIAKDTIEEKILELHASKRDLVNNILDGTHAAGSMSVEEMVTLIQDLPN